MLNLIGITQVGMVETPNAYEIEATAATTAPACDCLLPKVVSNGRKKVSFIDTPMHGKKVEIVVNRQRYLCQNCRRTHYAEIPHMHERHRMTMRCYAYIAREGTKRSWKALALDLGVDAQTIADVWNRWADGELAKVKVATPDWMGIDELYIMGKYRAIITNVRAKALVTMLPSRDVGTLQVYFTEKFDTETVKVVTMDMFEPYRIIVKRCFPNAKIVVDRFHVMMHVSKAVDSIRISYRRQLDKKQRTNLLGDRFLILTAEEKLSAMQKVRRDAVLEQYPVIREAYQFKEEFRAVWNFLHREDAEKAIAAWRVRVLASPTCADPFKPLLTALDNWHEEIFAYMNWRLTNAYTEGFNAMARRMDRHGNGYSFEALKKRLIMAHGLQFRQDPQVAFNFPYPPGPPKDIGAVVRRMYPVKERPVVGYRLSTLAKIAGRLPLD